MLKNRVIHVARKSQVWVITCLVKVRRIGKVDISFWDASQNKRCEGSANWLLRRPHTCIHDICSHCVEHIPGSTTRSRSSGLLRLQQWPTAAQTGPLARRLLIEKTSEGITSSTADDSGVTVSSVLIDCVFRRPFTHGHELQMVSPLHRVPHGRMPHLGHLL